MSSSHWFVLGVIFLVVVVPMLIGNRTNKEKKQKKNSRFFDGGSMDVEIDSDQLDELRAMTSDLNQRISNLESILDAESPKWRTKYGQS